MRIVYISKYVILPEFGAPTRQYFISKSLSQIKGNDVLLIGSRSTYGKVPKINGLALHRKEKNIEFVTLNGPKIELGFNIKRLWSWLVFEVNLIRFRKKIKIFKPDVVIVSSLSILTFLSGVYLKRFLNVPLVVEIRDIYPLTLIELGGYSNYNPIILFLKWVEKLGYQKADLIISTLPNAKQHIENVLKTPFNFYWMPMGIDKSFFTKSSITAKDLYNKKEGEFIVGYAGSIGKANALNMVFEAASLLNKEKPYIKFLFVGEGPLKASFQEKYKHLPNIIFLPMVSKNDLPIVIDIADIVINPVLNKPIYEFGISPNKWIDYMFSAKPILVPFSGYKCIINEAECGIFTPAEDLQSFMNAIIYFSMMSTEDLKTIGNNGKKYLLKNLTYDFLSYQLNQKLQSLKNKN